MVIFWILLSSLKPRSGLHSSHVYDCNRCASFKDNKMKVPISCDQATPCDYTFESLTKSETRNLIIAKSIEAVLKHFAKIPFFSQPYDAAVVTILLHPSPLMLNCIEPNTQPIVELILGEAGCLWIYGDQPG